MIWLLFKPILFSLSLIIYHLSLFKININKNKIIFIVLWSSIWKSVDIIQLN